MDARKRRKRRLAEPLFIAGLVVFSGAVFMRLWKLSNIPGILGDESWYGLQALKLLAGQPVRWRTPTTPWMNPFYISLVALTHLVLPASEYALRLPGAMCGLAALAGNYFSARALFGRRTARISTLALSVLAVNIAYSRFGWDSSQIALFTILLFYSSLAIAAARNPGRFIFFAAILYPAAVLVHAVNALTVVFPLTALAVRYGRTAVKYMFTGTMRRRLMKWTALSVAIGMALTVVWPGVREFDRIFGSVQSHLANPRLYVRATRGFIDLLSGAGPYTYIAGKVHLPAARTIIVCLVMLASIVVFFRTYRHQGRTDRLLWGSTAAALFLFFAFTGAFGLSPERERYALFLPAPIVLCMARSFSVARAAAGKKRGGLLTGAGLVLALVLLGDFYFNVFYFIEATGGPSERQLVTGKVDPKFAAVRHVLSNIPEGRKVYVLVDGWALRSTGQYLAHGRSEPDVREAKPPTEGTWKPAVDGPYWIITYKNGVLPDRLAGAIKEKLVTKNFKNYAGRTVVVVLGPSAGPNSLE